MIGRFSNTSVYKEIFKSSDFLRIITGAVLIPLAFYLPLTGAVLPDDLTKINDKITLTNLVLLVSVLINGLPIILEALKGILEKELNVDELVSIAIIASLVIGNYFEAAMISFIMVLGAFMEEFVSDGARGAIESLVKVNPEKASVENSGKIIEKNIEDVTPGEIVIIKAGEIIPLDGDIIDGSGSIDESLLTGEPLPVSKKEGDSLSAGTINLDGYIKLKVLRSADNSTISKIAKLVENAENSKTKSTRIVDEYAGYFTPVIISISLFTYFFTGDVHNAITVLVVGCPCSFLLAGPVSIVAAVARAAKSGIMVKGGVHLENLADSNAFYFDKTGTLTNGKPVIKRINTFKGYTENQVLGLASKVEKGSTHPIAVSIMEKASEIQNNDETASEIVTIPGVGVEGIVNGVSVKVQADKTDESTGDTKVLVLIDNIRAGEIILYDRVRENAENMVTSLKEAGVKDLIILSGDCEGAVSKAAEKTGVNEFYSRCTPEDKMQIIENRNKVKSVFLGDGINDAPALKAAGVGISMGLKGSQTALETSDIVLMNDNITMVPFLLKLSRKMKNIIKFNLIISLLINFIAIIMGIMGLLTPVTGAVAHNIGSLFVVFLSSSLVMLKEN